MPSEFIRQALEYGRRSLGRSVIGGSLSEGRAVLGGLQRLQVMSDDLFRVAIYPESGS